MIFKDFLFILQKQQLKLENLTDSILHQTLEFNFESIQMQKFALHWLHLTLFGIHQLKLSLELTTTHYQQLLGIKTQKLLLLAAQTLSDLDNGLD